jgi:hypothetical protein
MNLELKFKSYKLVNAIVNTIEEIIYMMRSLARYWIKGFDLAKRISEFAFTLGYRRAILWRYDNNFIVYWGMIISNNSYYGGFA